jgi:hypothetical protein
MPTPYDMLAPRVLCAECHCTMADDAHVLVEGRLVHTFCALSCANCDTLTLRGNSSWATNGDGLCVRVCQDCHDTQTFSCHDCDALFTDDAHDEDGLCYSCGDERRNRENAACRVIGPYHNPDRRAATMPLDSTWTRAHGGRFVGVELEVELRSDTFIDDERQNVARSLLDVANADMRRMWAENDGSLNWGFELITQPMGLDAHVEMWPRVLANAARTLRSHDTTTCGLHVHVTRRGLTALQIARAVVFLNAPENEVLVRAIARRYGNSYCRIGKKALRNAADSCDRYEMLNLTNSRTVEFRLFRGTLRAETLLACVEFANAVLEFARTASNNALTTDAFLAHVYDAANASDTKHLRRFFARRVTERAAPRYEPLKSAIEAITKRALRAPRVTDRNAPWAEV